MKIKVRIKHLEIKNAKEKRFIVSDIKDKGKCCNYNLLWSSTFKILNLSLFLFGKKEIVETKYFIYIHVRRMLYYYRN